MTPQQFVEAWLPNLRLRCLGKDRQAVVGEIVSHVEGEAPSEWCEADSEAAIRLLRGVLLPRPTPESGTRTRNQPDASLHTSPYRFITIPDGVVLAPPPVRQADNATPLAEGYCGTIEVEWAVETPMLIGVTEGEGANEVCLPMSLGDGNFVIPGATLRGMVRSTMEIVCRARLTQVNTHHRYPLRDFTHSSYKGRTTSTRNGAGLLTPQIHAGWLQENGLDPETGRPSYSLTPCDYGLVKVRDFLCTLPNWAPGNRALGDQHLDWLRLELPQKYEAADMLAPAGNGQFYFQPQSDTFTAPDQELKIAPAAMGREGVYVFSGASPNLTTTTGTDLENQNSQVGPGLKKKRECVFFDRANARPCPIRGDAWDRFERMNCVPSRHGRTPVGAYADLAPTLLAQQRIPVFYVGDLGGSQRTLEIGLTRLFKIGHDYSVGDKLLAERGHNPDVAHPDMVEALFGHVFEAGDLALPPGSIAPSQVARKGRVAFGFAPLTEGSSTVIAASAVMMAPRASFAPFYLKGKYKDWSDPDARLAGRKRYFPRFSGRAATAQASRSILANLAAVTGTDDMRSQLRFLASSSPDRPLVFRGQIRLHNVLREEIGALLWTLTHGGDPDKPCRHMLGRAKPAGAGQTRVRSVTLKLARNDGTPIRTVADGDAETRWETTGGTQASEGWTAPGTQSMTPFLQAFDNYMKRAAAAAWPDAPEIRELIACSTPGVIATPQPYPQLPSYAEIRKATKHHSGQLAPTAPAGSRFLTIPNPPRGVLTPYRERQPT